MQKKHFATEKKFGIFTRDSRMLCTS